MKTLCLVVTFAVIILVIARVPRAMAMTMDCSRGETMMLEAHTAAHSTPAMSGNVDKDFAAMEMQASKAQVIMAQVEMTCGKTASEKLSAAKLLKESQDRLRILEQGLRPELRS